MSKKKGKIKEIKVKEKELESLLIKDLSVIDDELKILGRQIETDSGVLDVLAFYQENKSLAIMELKVEEEDRQLFQVIRYYDWVKSRIELIRRSFRKDIDTSIDPWVILIAPSFSEELKKVARYVCIPYLSLFEYSVLELPNGEKHVFCKDVDYGEPYEQKEIPTVQGHLDYITEENVKLTFSNALSVLKENGIEVQPRIRSLTLLIGSKIIGRIRCRRNFFKVKSSLREGQDTYHIINTQEEWDSFFKKRIRPFI